MGTEWTLLEGKTCCIQCREEDLLIETTKTVLNEVRDGALFETGESLDARVGQAQGFCKVCGRQWAVQVSAEGRLLSAKLCAPNVEYSTLSSLIHALCTCDPKFTTVPINHAVLYFQPETIDHRFVYVNCAMGYRRMRLDDVIYVGMTIVTSTTVVKVVP